MHSKYWIASLSMFVGISQGIAQAQQNTVTQQSTPQQNTVAHQAVAQSSAVVVDTVGYSAQRYTLFQESNTPVQQPTMPIGIEDQIREGARDPSLDPALRASVRNDKSPIVIPPLKSPNVSIQGIGTGATPEDRILGRLPAATSLPTGFDREVPISAYTKEWLAPGFCHKPLYFQDTMLERHGHRRSACVQPFASGVRFFGTLPLLPYLMTLHPPGEDIYSLGHYRPGTAAPCLFERPPYDRHALGVQAGVTAGVFVGFPFK